VERQEERERELVPVRRQQPVWEEEELQEELEDPEETPVPATPRRWRVY